jgi:hypothetical protein
MARDYATVQVYLDDEKLGLPINLYNFPDVITTGVIRFGRRKLEAGKHRLVLEIVGSDPSAQAAQFVGLDYIQLDTSGK